MENNIDVNILECTLRDGSYAVDFKFTEADTGLLTGLLSRLGFRWIEIGHGYGLGASEKGRGKMPSSDEALISAAKSVAAEAKIGMFCIPGIASIEMLDQARDAGLDFVRVGQNAPDAEKAYPFLERARKIGLFTTINFMKSYAITPKEFGMKAKNAYEAGAEVIYLVDSVGGMFREDVERYLEATRNSSDCKIGFHSHDNLKLAIANSIQAYYSGATFIDTTLYGLGRSAGNAATEVLIAIFNRLGISCGIDFFEVLDVAETYMRPLMSQIQMHDMVAVAMGYGQFHSAFLPMVATAAQKYKVDLKRLIVAMGNLDPVNIDEQALAETAASLANTASKRRSYALLSFDVPELAKQRISTSLYTVQSLIDGMVVTSAKRRGTKTVLELIPADKPTAGLVLPEFVLADQQMVLGRVTFGSYEVLRDILDLAKNQIFIFLMDIKQSPWAKDAIEIVATSFEGKRVIPIRSDELYINFILDTLEIANYKFKFRELLLYGFDQRIFNGLKRFNNLQQIFLFEAASFDVSQLKDVIRLTSQSDWLALNLKFDLILCSSVPSEQDARILGRVLSANGKIIYAAAYQCLSLKDTMVGRMINLERSMAYSGLLERLLVSASLLGDELLSENC